MDIEFSQDDVLLPHNKVALCLAMIYILINLYYGKIMIIFIFIICIIIFVMFYGKYSVKTKLSEVVAFSLIISFLFSILLGKTYSQEGFTNKKKLPKKNIKKKNNIKKKKNFNSLNKSNDDTDNFVGNNRVDIGSSFLEAYKNLDQKQIKTMTRDTKDLIKTQKTLMSTLEHLAPVVKEGKSIIDTFKGYFDNK